MPIDDSRTPGGMTLLGLEPGTWRLAILETGTFSDPVRVASGGEPAELTIDVSTAVAVQVVWKVPDGEDPRFLELGPEARPRFRLQWRSWEEEWPLPEEDGTANPVRSLGFDLRAPPKLEVRHPYLVGSKWNDAIDLTKPRSAITLHMELGPLLTMKPELPDGVARVDGAFVTLRTAEGSTEVRRALRRYDTFAMAPPAAGTRRVLIDPVVAAPVELASVAFDGGPRDLGAIRFTRGSTLHVHARATAPFAAPRVMARATRIDGIVYARASSAKEVLSAPCDPEIHGLGAGLFRVTVEGQSGFVRDSWTAEVRVDGERDAEVTIVTD